MMEPTPEADSVARRMALAYEQTVQFYRSELGLTSTEADAKAGRALTPEYVERLMTKPPEQVSWHELGRLLEGTPEQSRARWQSIRDFARDEFRNGHRAAAVLDFDSNPLQRARFLSLREEFIRGWGPRDAIELTLIDNLAQAETLKQFWIERLNMLSTGEANVAKEKYRRKGFVEPPRVNTTLAVEQASHMVDLFDRVFLRVLRSLRVSSQICAKRDDSKRRASEYWWSAGECPSATA